MAISKRIKKSPSLPLASDKTESSGQAEASVRRPRGKRLTDAVQYDSAISACIPCVTFLLQRDKAGDIKIIDISENVLLLLQRHSEECKESFALFLDIIDPPERHRLQDAIAISATRRSPIVWEGKLRTKGKQKTKWIRVRTTSPKLAGAAATWQGVITDISRERDLESALKRSREQLSELSSYLEAGKEEERERIARDIHDELGSLLVALKIEAALLSSKLPKNLASLHKKAQSIESLLDQAMGTASRVARELRPGILKEFGLSAAIECQAEDFSQRTGITCRAQCDDGGPEIEERSALVVFRIVQEALTNVAKHAHASLVALRLYQDRQQLVVEIRDNGRGISDADMHKPKSFGLRGIRERVRSLNGELSITPGEQGGTHIMLSLPLKTAGRRATSEDDFQHKLF